MNSQTISLLEAEPKVDPKSPRILSEVTIVGEQALLPDVGPLGAGADLINESGSSDQVSVYVVRDGDTIGGIAKMFGVSVNTIRWANDLAVGAPLKKGETLLILPVSGVKYSVKKGDTLAGIAKRFKADQSDIESFNGITSQSKLSVGDEIIIPGGMIENLVPVTGKNGKSRLIPGAGGPSIDGYYIKPVPCNLTQGLHGHNGVDLGCSRGTPIRASASGTVLIARTGWNGGYGTMIVIAHGNGTQTLYAHMSALTTSSGENVSQGQIIGASGSTGKSTGPHLHFEVRGAKNPGVDNSWAQ